MTDRKLLWTRNATTRKQYFVYIMANKASTVLYTGITGNLKRRAFQHREGLVEGFTKRYSAKRLVYYEMFEDPVSAIHREKQIKAGSRAKKMELIDRMNPRWRDLYSEI